MAELVILYDKNIKDEYWTVISDLISHKKAVAPESLLTFESFSRCHEVTHYFRKKFLDVSEDITSLKRTDEKNEFEEMTLIALVTTVLKHIKFGITTRKLFLIFVRDFNTTHPVLTCKTFAALISSCEKIGWKFIFLGEDGSIGRELGCNISVTLNDTNEETLMILRKLLDSFEKSPIVNDDGKRPE